MMSSETKCGFHVPKNNDTFISMELKIKEEENFRYVEEGEGPVLILLHGLFGALSNFNDLIQFFKKKYKVVIPLLPLYSETIENSNIHYLLTFLKEFIALKKYKNITAIGNSLGGHLALKYVLDQADNVRALVLTGSSGLFEKSLGNSYPRKGDYEFVKTKTEETFYNPKVASKELVDEVFDIVNNREKALRVLYMARSAIKDNLKAAVNSIKKPTLVIWGKNDTITPPFVAEDLNNLIENSKLVWIDKCGHAAMMECPQIFNTELQKFLDEI